MWRTVKRRVLGGAPNGDGGLQRPRSANLQFRVPSPYGGQPWVTATIAVSTTPVARGETVRIRAHVDSCLHTPENADGRAAIGHQPAPHGLRAGLTRYGRDVAASAARRAVAYVPNGVLRRISQQRRRSWVDMQISTAPLDAGASALMPAALRERYGEKLPQLVPGAPRVGVWAGPAGGPLGGLARLAMVQFDDSDLAGGDEKKTGDRFSLNLTIGELIEPVSSVASGDHSH